MSTSSSASPPRRRAGALARETFVENTKQISLQKEPSTAAASEVEETIASSGIKNSCSNSTKIVVPLFTSFTEEVLLNIASPLRQIKNDNIGNPVKMTVAFSPRQKQMNQESLQQLQQAQRDIHHRVNLATMISNLSHGHLFAPVVMWLEENEEVNGEACDEDDSQRKSKSLMQNSNRDKNKEKSNAHSKKEQKSLPQRRQRRGNKCGDDEDAEEETSDQDDDEEGENSAESKSFLSRLPKNVAIFCRSPSCCVDFIPKNSRANQHLQQQNPKNSEHSFLSLHHHHQQQQSHLRKHKMIPHQIPEPVRTKIICSFCSRQAKCTSSRVLADGWLQCPATGCCCTRPPLEFLTQDEGIILPLSNSVRVNKDRHFDAKNNNNSSGSGGSGGCALSIGALRRSLCKQCVLEILDDPRFYRSVEDWKVIRSKMASM